MLMWFLLSVYRVCFWYSEIFKTMFLKYVRKARGLNILQYEKKNRLINSLLMAKRWGKVKQAWKVYVT